MLDYGTNESWYWHSPTMEVRFRILKDGKPVVCRVTHECIKDHCGNPADESACFTAAKQNFDAITDQVGYYVSLGRFEPDGTVLLRTTDWR